MKNSIKIQLLFTFIHQYENSPINIRSYVNSKLSSNMLDICHYRNILNKSTCFTKRTKTSQAHLNSTRYHIKGQLILEHFSKLSSACLLLGCFADRLQVLYKYSRFVSCFSAASLFDCGPSCK